MHRYTLKNVLSDVWTFEMSDYTWRLADIVAKPSPPRFKMSAAMYEPPLGNARGLENMRQLLLTLAACLLDIVAAHGGTSNYTIDGIDYAGYFTISP